MKWTDGNAITLLENGEAFFPRVFDTIAAAQREVLVETFILFEDKVGWGLHAALLAAARNGAQVDLTVDGYGSPDLSPKFLEPLHEAGVRVHVYAPARRLFGWRANIFRRLHRKLVVVDGERAFIGGINYSADHLADFGPQAKQDYSVECVGPIVAEMHRFALDNLGGARRPHRWFRRHAAAKEPAGPARGDAQAMLVQRDNDGHPNDIERHYRVAIRSAKRRIIIANAYFFPGYRLLKELRRAARRGVDVRLVLQGEPDMQFVKTAAELLYDHLLKAGVKIHEYCERPLHGKVAVVDDLWSTVGSSNLDPLSLSLNLEANVMVRDAAFNRTLTDNLEHLMRHSCRQIEAAHLPGPSRWHPVRSFFVFHFLRRFPALAGWLPAHSIGLHSLGPLTAQQSPEPLAEPQPQ